MGAPSAGLPGPESSGHASTQQATAHGEGHNRHIFILRLNLSEASPSQLSAGPGLDPQVVKQRLEGAKACSPAAVLVTGMMTFGSMGVPGDHPNTAEGLPWSAFAIGWGYTRP